MQTKSEMYRDGNKYSTSDKTGLASKYFLAKEAVISHGYESEILWQSSLCFDDLDESAFLRELSWVILSSGMRERVIRNIFGSISKCFFDWVSSKKIIENKEDCLNDAMSYFNNKSKMSAIIFAAEYLVESDFRDFKIRIFEDPISVLQRFPYIGPITVYHLAKNIGLPFAKPDRHLLRMANYSGYSDVQLFCKEISELSGDSIPVVDVVLWRFATFETNYLKLLK